MTLRWPAWDTDATICSGTRCVYVRCVFGQIVMVLPGDSPMSHTHHGPLPRSTLPSSKCAVLIYSGQSQCHSNKQCFAECLFRKCVWRDMSEFTGRSRLLRVLEWGGSQKRRFEGKPKARTGRPLAEVRLFTHLHLKWCYRTKCTLQTCLTSIWTCVLHNAAAALFSFSAASEL